ncbi:E3 ubiquitin-protein ligase rnf213-alpha-like isoform X1 [Clavelina lepadiformis]|uniref:E3 ubiquitin-protein ligase rnf213-alpha-like isoform X1 n=1 Tax=Clavelina lepadiformis TaxID=159417 RepID=UPI00404112F7
MWLAIHWNNLQQCSATVKRFAIEFVTSQQDMFSYGDMWLCHVIHKIIKIDQQYSFKFMQKVHKFIDKNLAEFEHDESDTDSTEASNDPDNNDMQNDNVTSAMKGSLETVADGSDGQERLMSIDEAKQHNTTSVHQQLKPTTTNDVITVVHNEPDASNSCADTGKELFVFVLEDVGVTELKNMEVSSEKRSNLEPATAATTIEKKTYKAALCDSSRALNLGPATKLYNLRPNNAKHGITKSKSKDGASLEKESGVDKSAGYSNNRKSKKKDKQAEKLSQNNAATQKEHGEIEGDTSEGIIVEFALLIDKKFDWPANAKCYIYLQSNHQSYEMVESFQHARYFCWQTTLQPKLCTRIVYKFYYDVGNDKKHWEKLPKQHFNNSTNRLIQVSAERMAAGHLILFDVAGFDLNETLSDFNSMYSRNIQEHLPQMSTVKINVVLGDDMLFDQFLLRLMEWWQCAKSGICFEDAYSKHNSFNWPAKILPTCKTELENYITTNFEQDAESAKSNMGQKTLAYIAMAIFFEKQNFEAGYISGKAWKSLCQGLSLLNMEKDQIKSLFTEIAQNKEKRAKMLIALDYLVQKNKGFLRSLFLFPIYYILCNEGDCAINDNIWSEVVTKFHLSELSSKIERSQELNSDLIQALLSPTFPKMIDVVMIVLPCHMVLHHINKSSSLQYLLPNVVLLKVATEVSQDNLTKFIQSKKFMSWINNYIEDLITKCNRNKIGSDEVQWIALAEKKTMQLLKNLQCSSEKKLEDLQIVLSVTLNIHKCSMLLQENSSDGEPLFGESVSPILKVVIGWINNDISDQVYFQHIQFWNYLLAADLLHESESETWKSQISDAIQDRLLEKLKLNKDLIEFFGGKLEKMKASKETESCFSEAIYQFAYQVSKEARGLSSWFWGSEFKQKLVPILERLFHQEWHNLSQLLAFDGVLQFVIHWPFAVHFFKLFGDQKNRKMLNNNTQKCMDFIKQTLQLIILDVSTGNISFNHMQQILAEDKIFLEALSILKTDKDKETSVDSMEMIGLHLDKKAQDLTAFTELKRELEYFVELCESNETLALQVTELQAALNKNISALPWSEIFETQSSKEPQCFPVNIAHLQFSDAVKRVVKEIFAYKINDTELAQNIFYKEMGIMNFGKDDQKKPDTLDLDAMVPIWKSTKCKLSALKYDVDSGKITLDRVNAIFGDLNTRECGDAEKICVSNLMSAIYVFPDVEVCEVDQKETFSAEDEVPQHIKRNINPNFNLCNDKEHTLNDEEESISSDVFAKAEQKIDLGVCGEDEESITDVTSINYHRVEPDTNTSAFASSSAEASDKLSNLEYACSSVCPRSEQYVDELHSENPAERQTFRIEQISNYFALKQQQLTASVLYDLKQCLQLNGDFSYLEIVQENESISQTQPLKCISSDIIKAIQAIKDINEKQLDMLKGFLQNAELIEWLRNNMKDRGEVKVMSDLAMISAGETILEVDRVSCFLSAVMGFAPFIFDLEENANLTNVVDALKKVWEAYSNDNKLLKKWHGTAQYLEWLKGIKDFHGSVEKSSLSRAQDINAHGVYIISGETEPIPTTKNALKLELSTNQDADKVMTVEELHNLQSRLMLIAGEAEKGLDEVKVFIEVLAHVENLTKAYVKLKSAGCLLFNNWNVKLRFRAASKEAESDGSKSSIEISFDDKSQPMLCKDNVLDEMKKLAIVLGDAHEKWVNNLNEIRKQFYHLNHFSIQQITYLCKELAGVDEFGVIPDQVFTLLACIKRDVSDKDIIQLLQEATNAKNEEDGVVDDEKDQSVAENIVLSPIEQKKQMARRLLDEDMSERLAKASVQAVGLPLDYDDCYLKSLEIEFDEAIITEMVKAFDKEIGFDASSSEINVIESVINDRSNLTLQNVIEKILGGPNSGKNIISVALKTVCERYMEATSVTSLSDCISIEHFGHFATNLSLRVDKKDIIVRHLSENLEPCKPNLIICQEQEVFSTLLSLYMDSPEQPLPTPSEVLLCSKTTNKMETELLLRRAMQTGIKTGTKIYCLAFADSLTFDVANATENMIRQLEKESNLNPNYKLVIICSSPQQYIASLLYENRVEYNFNISQDKIQTYLNDHLAIDETQILGNDTEMILNTVRTTVQVVLSNRAGLGKSLHISRCRSYLPESFHKRTIRFLEKQLDKDDVMQCLLPENEDISNRAPHFIHFDVTPSVQEGVNKFMFNLLILGAFQNSLGVLWRRHPSHLYFVEFTNSEDKKGVSLEQRILGLLPAIYCISPRTIVSQNFNGNIENYLLMDEVEFQSETYQRPYQFLHHYSRSENLDKFSYKSPTGTPEDCIETLLRYSSITDPTWSELRHFASFLNCQLLDCEHSLFCNEALVGADSGLSGFKKFVVRFMIRMSQDFATPSLSLPDAGKNDVENSVFELHQLRRHWEEDVHPYLFFNEDHMSMTFVNFQLNQNGDLLHPKTKRVMENSLMRKQLMTGLKLQRVNLNEDFDALSRQHKLLTLCRVMGIKEDIDDPDPTYELTTDNVLKMLAIHMRFRCGIPVVVMGETGCGKTRMIEFMSKLKAGNNLQVQNMLIVKVHGGITVPIIQEKVRKAVVLARNNKTTHAVETMLFLDEANTTEAIYAIKEFVCDQTVHGEAFNDTGLNIVAACNPYRRHSEDALKSMEESGLGFRVKTDKTADKLGSIPMRCLVYRVIALPPSMQPLVWDFGQLTNDAEKVYIEQMVSKLKEPAAARSVFHSPPAIQLTVNVLATSQKYMREQRQQCSFVSLRDVERCLTSFLWFYHNQSWLFPMIQQENNKTALDPIVRTLLQAVGMCYHVTLEERDHYREEISRCLRSTGINLSSQAILDEITACQAVFINNIKLEDDIARNEALRENVFMMVMCTEMRIPLFLIGKPGSSKSLAKTIVTDAMQGPSSRSPIFQRLKQIHVLSFQCSAVSDAIGIEAVFGQCAQVQKNQDPDKFVSVVVLDEVGLAEDSPKMPLKVLHPLLEGGGATSEEPFVMDRDDQKRVGFVGISNWALDPAKMNRGIFVHRGDPTENDLKLTAKGIFSSETTQYKEIGEIVDVLTASYLEIRKSQEQEFFGLRDYYGLLKMIFAVANKSETDLEYYHVASAIKRNFSGGKIDCVHIFLKHLQRIWPDAKVPKFSLESMIRSNLDSVNDCESRFLLLLSNQFTAMGLLNKIVDCSKFQVIFGSSFPQDNDYTELCRNINKIKMCMESGCTVVLLNLRDLYESLYDALNQHYVTFAGQRYVDLGLGGHRVKCRVAKEFRLIVIEDKDVVYDQFPIPLINRLEKYIFTTDSILSGDQEEIADRLQGWISSFSEITIPLHCHRKLKQFVPQDCFIGYTRDSAAAALLSVIDSCKKNDQHSEVQKNQDYSYAEVQEKFLSIATVDSVFRLTKSKIKKEAAKLQEKYLHDQCHDNLFSFFHNILEKDILFDYPLLYEITSFSQIMSEQDRQKLESGLGLSKDSVMLLTLQQFQTQEEYSQKVNIFLKDAVEQNKENRKSMLLIQCPQAEGHGNLISCARYSIKNLIQLLWPNQEQTSCNIIIAFLFTIERTCGTNDNNSLFSLCTPGYKFIHIDELRISADYIGRPTKFWNKTMSEVLKESKASLQPSTTSCKLQDPNFILDPHALICNSIPNAIIKLTNKIKSNEHGDLVKRNRVKIMHHLCTGNTMITVPFLNVLFERIVKVVHNHDLAHGIGATWLLKEACSHEALQEGGTFGKTLWLRLKKMVTVAMAKIVSIIDEDDNLDLICDEQVDPHLADFWLRVFSNDDACNFKFSETFHAAIEFEIYNKLGFKCKFPFSQRITEMFAKQWLCMPNAENHATFYTKVENLAINNVVADLLENKPMHFLHCYAHDLVNLKYKSGYDDMTEMNLITEALLAIFKSKQRMKIVEGKNMIANIYASFMSSLSCLQQFSLFVGMFPDVLTKHNMDVWIAKQSECSDFVLHILAFHTILESLETNIQKLSEEKYYRKWRDLVKVVVNTDIVTVSSETEETIQKICIEVEIKRRSMAFIELFLKMLIPDGLEGELFVKYLKTLAPSARRLSKGAKITGLRDAKFLKIVIDILRGCKDKILLKHLLSWNDLKCRLCGKEKAVNPVVLPCKHFFCLDCIKVTTNVKIRKCPLCHQCFPEDFPISPTQLSAEQIVRLNAFKANCTSFFLEYLSNLCFPAPGTSSDSGVSEDVTELLQNLVICEKATRTMTPLDVDTEMFDKTPTVRSFILQLLLRYNPEKTQSILETHFQKQDQILSNRQELMMIYIRCIEDSLLNRFLAVQTKDCPNDFQRCLFSDLEDFFQSDEPFSQIDVLNTVAKLRYLIKQATDHFYQFCCSEDKNKLNHLPNSLLNDLSLLFKSYDISSAKQYFVKILCRRYGLNYFSLLNLTESLQELIPADLKLEKLEQKTTFSTLLYAIGPEYAATQKLFSSIEKTETFQPVIDNICAKAKLSTSSAVEAMHGVLTWVRSCGLETDNNRKAFFINLLENLEQASPIPAKLINHYKNLIFNENLLFNITLMTNNGRFIIRELVELIGSCIYASPVSLLVDLAELIANPHKVENMFLPTMPQSSYFEVKDVVASLVERYKKPPKPYLCPNRHVYYIGDCTNPNERGICPECKKAIGGVSGSTTLQPDNVAGELTEISQAGYLLGSAKDRSSSAVPERSSSRLSVCVMRMFLHSALIYAAANGDDLTRILKQRSSNQTQEFLFHHLEKDLNQFTNCLGKSTEDAILLLYNVMEVMRNTTMEKSPHVHFKSMEARKRWEIEFHNQYLGSVFAQSDEKIDESRKLCLSSQRQNNLERMVYEMSEGMKADPLLDEDDRVSVHSPSLWRFQAHVTVEHLRQRLEGMVSGDKDDGTVLKTILNETDLSAVQYLPAIVGMQAALIQRFKHKVDMADTDETAILDCCNDNDLGEETDFQLYFNVWNMLKRNFANSNAHGIPQQYFEEELSFESPISMLVPSKAGRGRCALALTEYVVEKQNNLLLKCRNLIIPTPSFKEVSIPDMRINDLICIDDDRSLLPLILANAEYEVTRGETGIKHRIAYRVPALEKQILDKFILNKKLIKKETLPCMEYLQDTGIEKECAEMQKNVEQSFMIPKIAKKLDDMMQKARHSDICEGVRTLTLVISYLAKVGSNQDQLLTNYITEDLHLPSDAAAMIPKTAQLRHTLALFERLSWQRSFRYLTVGLDPFAHIVDQEETPNVEVVRKSLDRINIPQLQLELNSFILIKQSLSPESSLRDNIQAYVAMKYDDDVDSDWCQNLPEDLKIKHGAHLFKISMEMS